MVTLKNCISYALLLVGFINFSAQSNPKLDNCGELVKDLGECGGTIARIVAYDQEMIFGQDDRGMHRCFELQDRIDSLNRDFEKRRTELRERGRNLKNMYQDQEMNANDPHQMAKTMKEQSALDIDAKLAQQEYQTRLASIQTDFLKEVQAIIQELADENDWDIVIPTDKKSAYVAPKVDITDKIIKRLNDKYRAKQRAKNFGGNAKKDAAATKA